MRILALRGRNLASLAGDFEVDLAGPVLGGAGLIAITGPTGAGKSTLLDALCLALFGRTPRLANAPGRERVALAGNGLEVDADVDHRDPRLLLSKGAGEGFAEVDFVGRDGRSYRARWDLRRARGRAEGRLQAARPSVEAIDGGPALELDSGKVREVQKLVPELLGLDFDQFRRSVLLAQNEFAEFLQAEPRERGRLLEALTDSGIYTRISILAFQRNKEHGEELRLCEARRAGIHCLDDARRDELAAGIVARDRELGIARGRGKELEAQQRWFADRDRLVQATGDARRRFRDCCGAIAERVGLSLSERGFLEDEGLATPALLGQGRTMLRQLEPRIAQARRLDEDCGRLAGEQARVEASRDGLRREVEARQGERREVEARLAPLREAVAALRVEWSERDPAELERELELRVERVAVERRALEDGAALLRRRAAALQQVLKAAAGGREAAELLAQARVELGDVERGLEALRGEDGDEAAARLRDGLQPGRPCPVCGSRHHPAVPEHRPGGSGREALAGAGREGGVEEERVAAGAGEGQELETVARGAAGGQRRLLERRRDGLVRDIGRREAEVEQGVEQEARARADAEALATEYADLRAGFGEVLPALGAVGEEDGLATRCAEAAAARVREEAEDRARRERLRDGVKQVAALAGLEVRNEALGEMLAEKAARLGELENDHEARKQALEVKRGERLSLFGGRDVADLVAELPRARDEGVRLEQAWAQETAHEETAPASPREAVLAELEALTPRIAGLEEEQAEQRAALKVDEQRRTERAEIETRIAELGQKAAVWAELNELVGSADGKRLRDFAQSLTLDRMLEGANAHLHDFARRYRIERIPGQSLALQILDRDMGDEVRSVHSLSGGESFLVSLALALGLSGLHTDVARIDSLFIDEGFGNLDERTLDQALEALDALQSEGRQVALISHVPGLAERLGRQVRVDKLGGGRSRVVVG